MRTTREFTPLDLSLQTWPLPAARTTAEAGLPVGDPWHQEQMSIRL